MNISCACTNIRYCTYYKHNHIFKLSHNHIFKTYISTAVCGSLLYRFFSIISWGVRLAVITSLFATLMLKKWIMFWLSMVGIHHRCLIYGYNYIITVTNSQSIMPWLHPILQHTHIGTMIATIATWFHCFCLFHVFEDMHALSMWSYLASYDTVASLIVLEVFKM